MPDHVAEVTGVSLGFGAFADVLEVRYKGKRYAAKVYRNIESETLMYTLFQERQILSLVQHKNVIPYYGTCLLKDAHNHAVDGNEPPNRLRKQVSSVQTENECLG